MPKKTFKCQNCEKSFQRKANLTEHVKEAHTNTSRSKLNCYQRFFDSVKWGPIYGCISCHIACFLISVQVFDEKLKAKLEKNLRIQKCLILYWKKRIITLLNKIHRPKRYLKIDKNVTGVEEYYICKTCKDSFLRNKIPSRCIFNECRVADQPDCLRNMIEVEVSLISLNLQFRKIFRMPKLQWAQLRDRVICVALPSRNIAQTISSLPRNTTDSGLIGVNWKRKVRAN